jgi:hypothetical protein
VIDLYQDRCLQKIGKHSQEEYLEDLDRFPHFRILVVVKEMSPIVSAI